MHDANVEFLRGANQAVEENRTDSAALHVVADRDGHLGSIRASRKADETSNSDAALRLQVVRLDGHADRDVVLLVDTCQVVEQVVCRRRAHAMKS